MDSNSLAQIVSLGPVGVVLVVLGGAAWRILVFLAFKLFNEDTQKGSKGLVVRAVDAHLTAIDQQTRLVGQLVERLDALENAVRQLASAQEKLAERHCAAMPHNHAKPEDN